MQVLRFEKDGHAFWGRLSGDMIETLPGAPWEQGNVSGEFAVPRDSVTLLTPVTPRKILAIGRNYRAHAEEMGHDIPLEPLVFFKSPESLLADGGTVLFPRESERVDYEGELAFVIGKRGRRIPEEKAMEYVFGYLPALDITARDLQKKDGQWWRAKGFDTFCPVGPYIETEVSPSDLLLETFVNGERRQSSRTSLMIFPIPRLIAHISAAMTLEPGDIILTGTPEGIGPLKEGETVEVRIQGVGTVRAVTAREAVQGETRPFLTQDL